VRRFLSAAVSMSLAVAACSLPTDEAAVPIESDQLPDVLRSDLEVTTPLDATPRSVTVMIYLVAAEAERNVVRGVDREVDPAAPFQDRIGLLFGQEIRSEEEKDLGWSNPLREFDLIEAIVNDNNVAIVDMVVLDDDGNPVETEAQVLADAAAQLVYTATGFPDILAVRIRINGEAVFLPTISGDTKDVVNRSDFENYDPDYVPPTTTTPSTTVATTPSSASAATTTAAP